MSQWWKRLFCFLLGICPGPDRGTVLEPLTPGNIVRGTPIYVEPYQRSPRSEWGQRSLSTVRNP